MPNYPVPYQNNWGYSGVGQQMYPQYNQQSMAQQMPQQTSGACPHGLIWVDGEIGAKAYQLPQGLPANQPVALWDTNDTIIYLKSVNPMGMPNPLQKAHYTLEEQRGSSGGTRSMATEPVVPDMSDYVRKEDMERVKRELMDAIHTTTTSSETSGRRSSRGE
jgi:hypothetical protein